MGEVNLSMSRADIKSILLEFIFFEFYGDAAFKSSYLYDFFLYKQIWLFYLVDGYLWLCCCMNNLYILTHITLRPNIQLLSNRQHASPPY